MSQRRGEGRRVWTLVALIFIGLAIAVISFRQAYRLGGTTWLGVVAGVGVSAIAAAVLVVDPPGGRQR